MARKPAICLVLALLAAGAEMRALEPATPLRRLARQSWTVENGLPQNTVPVLLQSRSGFVWAGTELGLARFDGISFRVFDHATTPALPDAEIRCVLDARGAGTRQNLWVGTGDGLVLWKNGAATVLTTRNGLPDNSIRGLVQTSDGMVWAWTELGLARWHGNSFEAVASENGLPGTGITSIAADAEGGLWVGSAIGVAVLRQGHWQPGLAESKKRAAGGAGAPLTASLVARETGGDVLIATPDGVFVAHDSSVRAIAGSTALPGDGISFLTRLANGVVAVASKSTVVLLPEVESSAHGAGRFVVSGQLPGSLAGSNLRGFGLPGSGLPGTRIESLLADREGSLWVGTNRGLARISTAAGTGTGASTVQLLPPTDPLAVSSVLSLLEDREGDIWAGTEAAGLHILRDAHFRTLGASNGLSSDATTAIVQDANKALWIGTRGNGLNRVSIGADGEQVTTNLTTANGLLSDVILSLAAGPSGELWVGTPDGLNRVGRGGISSFTSADGLPDDFIRSLLVAPDGSVWIGTRRGLTHLDPGRKQEPMQSFSSFDGLGSDLVGALALTPDGDLWIATLNGLSRLHKGKLQNYTTADGLSSNVITALDITPDGMLWIGTQGDGLNLWDGKRFLPIRDGAQAKNPATAPRFPVPAVIHAILHDDRGHVWIASDTGLTRAETAGLQACAMRGECNVAAATFTTADGLRSRETSSNSHPTACHTVDGQFWFATPRGVVAVDPHHFGAAVDQPPVAIERFAVDDQDVDQDADQATDQVSPTSELTRIAAGHMRFQFDYAGLSFASPQKLRYQFMLEGFDSKWTDAGTRRSAYYTNIPPGDYRFRVRASLDGSAFTALPVANGETGAAEAALSFKLLPHFYQTLWFRALAGIVVLMLILYVFRHRVRRVEREFRAVMAERNRIAREIHDTLAQGYVGISLQLEVLGELLRHDRSAAAAKHLALTKELVRDGLNDARQSIWALRSQDAGEQTLPIRLRRIVELAAEQDLQPNLEVHGAYRALSADAEQEILRVAQEAIHNVKKHAGASRLRVRLEYDARALALTISDNGRGFALASSAAPGAKKVRVGAANAAEGHYGLTGMQERAALIKGEFEIASEPGLGTTITLNVPAPEVPTMPKESSPEAAERKTETQTK